MMQSNKQDYVDACVLFLKRKIQGLNDIMSETQSSANSDTKSSAGDKHETSRAMAHLENERLGRQLEVLNLQLETIYTIKPETINSNITIGTIIECEDFNFFISTGLGKLKLTDKSLFFAIAPDSPIGIQLKNKKIGESITVGTKKQTLVNIM
ncbi:MAG: hypothetical protein ABF258_05160 [Flavobacteriales bacterium]